jgi:hypothetical protein
MRILLACVPHVRLQNSTRPSAASTDDLSAAAQRAEGGSNPSRDMKQGNAPLSSGAHSRAR